ncbi:hypothetical protein OXX80_002579 [Metschnikowia pulcherrima]
MSRGNRRPFYSIIVLLCVACAIYFVATGDTKSLGSARPLSSLNFAPKMEVLPPKDRDTKEELIPEKPKPAEEVSTKFTGEKVPETGEKAAELAPKTRPVADGFTETPFMPKMANETLKAQLGNSAWHLFHTILARYPEQPTVSEKTTLKSYIHLFSQVYPCGDCARHFQHLLVKYPPQVESRKTAALWGCHVHNKVNEKLHKAEYDCTKILEDYDCGCGDDEKEVDYTLGNDTAEHLRKVTLDEQGGKELGG